MSRRIIIMLPIAAGLALAGLFALNGTFSIGARRAETNPSRDVRSETPPAEKRYQGAASCSTAGCHNGNDPLHVRGSEYTCWSSRDPHARAYAVLETEPSRQIIRRYRRLSNEDDVRPFEDKTCLACHALNPPVESRGDRWTSASIKDGVSCESCHGPSEKWLDLHYQAEWKTLTRERKDDLLEVYGFRDTKDLAVRVTLCAECHVGSDKAEVNHDLIAAGHPRLMFEYSAYHHLLPRHWQEGGKDFEARAWEIGQVASARAALDLLHARATRSWPELSEYNCYACHHDLQAPGWRQKRDPGDGKIGSPRWSTWYFSAASVLAGLPEFDPAAPSPSGDPFGPLSRLMSQRSPERAQIAKESEAARDCLDHWLAALHNTSDPRVEKTQPMETERVRRLLVTFASEGKAKETTAELDWDEAVQRSLAIAALAQVLSDMDDRYRADRYRNAIRRLPGPLALPSDSARGIRFDSPRDFTPGEFRKILKQVHDAFVD